VELPLTTRTWPAAGPPPKVTPSSPNGINDQHDSSLKYLHKRKIGNLYSFHNYRLKE
jgi:hypothetical protein